MSGLLARFVGLSMCLSDRITADLYDKGGSTSTYATAGLVLSHTAQALSPCSATYNTFQAYFYVPQKKN